MSVTNNGARKRHAAFRERMVAAGFVQVSGWVHKEQAGAAAQLLRRLKEEPALLPGPVRDTRTGKLLKLEG